MKVGYQGYFGSNSEEAALRMLKRMGISTYELVPLISAANVADRLERGAIDLGVVAVRNSTAGVVSETFDILRNNRLESVCTEILPIHHCLFKKNAQIANAEITKVISHEQALRQCAGHIAALLPQAVPEPIADTAIGARYLAEGQYDERTAVLCRRAAGKNHGLYLEKEAMQDAEDNRTEFRMIRLLDHSREDRQLV